MEIEWRFSIIRGKMASQKKWETEFVLVQIENKLAPRLDQSHISAATWLRILRVMPRSSARTETGICDDWTVGWPQDTGVGSVFIADYIPIAILLYKAPRTPPL